MFNLQSISFRKCFQIEITIQSLNGNTLGNSKNNWMQKRYLNWIQPARVCNNSNLRIANTNISIPFKQCIDYWIGQDKI